MAMKITRLRMLRTYATPDLVASEGSTVEVANDTADVLVRQGYAVAIEQPDYIETARVRLVRNYAGPGGGGLAGSVIDLPMVQAASLVESGGAEQAEESPLFRSMPDSPHGRSARWGGRAGG